MRNCGNGVESRCGGGSRSCCGGERGLCVPTDVLELAGFSCRADFGDLVYTIEDGRILIEAPEDDEDEEAEIWDALRNQLPGELCARMEDAGLTAHEVWDILEEEGWFEV